MTLRDDELTALLEAGESDGVEFKEALTGGAAEAIREAICAFANDLPGHGLPGAVFVGVRDDGSAAGLPITDELLRQLADMKTDGNIVPPPSSPWRPPTRPRSAVAAPFVSGSGPGEPSRPLRMKACSMSDGGSATPRSTSSASPRPRSQTLARIHRRRARERLRLGAPL